MKNLTAAEKVKTFGPNGLQFINLGELRSFMEDKGFDLEVISNLAKRGYWSLLFRDLVLQSKTITNLELLDQFGEALPVVTPLKFQSYKGADEQNARIDAAIANGGLTLGPKRYGEGAATFFDSKAIIPDTIRDVPIAVIGYGAAGIMVSYALKNLGFRKVTVFEKTKTLGIWSYDNVARLSRNNPLSLQFFDSILEPAPGGGREVSNFLTSLSIIRPTKSKVEAVVPGNLKQIIQFGDGTSTTFPIVINAMGLGKPKPVSDPRRMTTKTGSPHAGARWQQQLELVKILGQRFIFIGLGNSTAEMLRQIHTFVDDGYEIDYRVITHYPEESVQNPSTYIQHRNRSFRVFRDISKPNLVDYQGDLAHSRYDYYRALHEGKIISGVRRWEVFSPNVLTVFGGNSKAKATIPFDKIMTLIGYRHSAETMGKFGCAYDPEHECGVFDYDGEANSAPGQTNPQKRLYEGYFGFGSILETPLNPNAIVIPGMIHRMGDLLYGVVMRAAQYKKKSLLR